MSDEKPNADDEDPHDGLDESFLPTGDGDEEPAVVDNAVAPSDGAGMSPDVDPDAPLGDLADRARRSSDGPANDDVMDAFSEVEVGDVDVEQLWAELEDEDIEETVDEPRGSSEQDRRVVSKRDYCQRCQYFSAPPEVRCTNETAEIVEMVDTEQFEVANCPILRGEEELENLRR